MFLRRHWQWENTYIGYHRGVSSVPGVFCGAYACTVDILIIASLIVAFRTGGYYKQSRMPIGLLFSTQDGTTQDDHW